MIRKKKLVLFLNDNISSSIQLLFHNPKSVIFGNLLSWVPNSERRKIRQLLSILNLMFLEIRNMRFHEGGGFSGCSILV